MDIADFDFDLPDELIAQHPPQVRGASRLLVLNRGTGAIEHAPFASVGDYLRPGDLLVLNDTRVFPARLLGRRVPSGGAVECLLLRRISDAGTPEIWEALVHPGQKLRPGSQMVFEGDGTRLHGEILSRHFHGRRTVRFRADDGSSVLEIVEHVGHVPLPRYIRRRDDPADRVRYQTVYAREDGSVAAPTAGLHFTTELLEELAARGIERTSITLHVGYGTFQPVRASRVEDHTIDAETFIVSVVAAAAIGRAHREGRRVVAVGTTTVRALESLAAAGGELQATTGETRLFIRPGHDFRLVDAVLTNFHLPRSSLLVLVAAFAGRERVLAAYREAVLRGYHFYSYGDAMLIL